MEGIVGGLLSGALGLGSAFLGADAASSAADTQAAAAREAARATEARYGDVRNLLMPFISGGYDSTNILRQLTGANAGGNPLLAPLTRAYTGADLENTPGYQFTRDQGLKSLYNGYAARGLGNSTAAMKGGARYVNNLAQTTFNEQLKNDLTQRQAVFNMLFPQSGQGLQGAQALAGVGSQMQGQSNALMGTAAASSAAGDIGIANAYQSFLNPLAQLGLTYSMRPDLFNSNTPQASRGVYGDIDNRRG